MTGRPPDLAELVSQVEAYDQIAQGWESSQRGTFLAMRATLEQLHAEALRRLIRTVKEDPGGLQKLAEAVKDPFVGGVLAYHGLLRAPAPSVEDRVQRALATVRPTLAGHAGDIELVKIAMPEVHVKLLGSCDGCPLSSITVRNGVETAIREAVPEVERVVVVDARTTRETGVPADSPYQRPFEDAIAADAVKEGAVVAVELSRSSVLITRVQGKFKAYPNACTHLGMPLDTGNVDRDGVLTCRYHGFKYLLESGECLTAPEVALPSYPIRTVRDRILVQVTT